MVLQNEHADLEVHEMNTKLRAIIYALAASASIGVAPVAPGVAQAQDSSSHSLSASMCEGSKAMAQHDVEESVEAVGRGDYDDAAFWSNAASEELQEANKWCAEAAAEDHSPIRTVVASGGIITTPPVTARPVVKVTRPLTALR
jgi:hypothetical protein